MAAKKDTLINMFVALFVICIVSGGVLGVVYNATKDPIAAAEAAKKTKAIKNVLPEFYELKETTVKSAMEDVEIPFHLAYDADNNFIGAAVETFTNKGFSGNISLMVGILADGSIKNITVLQHAETPGLGSKMSEPEFKDQFNDKKAGSFNIKVKKDGGDVDAITAATISSRAFCDAVNRALLTFENNKGGF
ncbi:MAG: RnfABCDGE type electron transport complex subunit G [Bacteroidales bacterium]|nr:RnfABCDGE type electron transport complex subunit G [Bacteroidales bacterium]MBR5781156.1 RnfABCDGE type electron transport complex subunit G [Bacteroidales bacterium]